MPNPSELESGDDYLQGAAWVLRQHVCDLVEANEKLTKELEDLRDA